MSENPSRSRERELELGAVVRRVVARHLPE
jgi:hypothetical protein